MAEITETQVNLFFDDVDRGLEFYRGLGFAEAFRYPEEGLIEHVEVDAAGVRIGLTRADVVARVSGTDVDQTATSAQEIAFWTDDVDGLLAEAVQLGARVLTEPLTSPDGRLRVAWFADPAGHRMKLVSPAS